MRNDMSPRREQMGYTVTAMLDRVMRVPGMRERIEQYSRECSQQKELAKRKETVK